MNYNQIITNFSFENIYRSSFIYISYFFGFRFAFYKPSLSTPIQCLLLNNNSKLSSDELFKFCSFFQTINPELIEEDKELDFFECIDDQNIIPFTMNLISIKQLLTSDYKENLETISNSTQFVSFLSQFPTIFHPKNFFFYNIEKTFSLKLNSDSKTYDLVDFDQNSYKLRFNKPDCFWISPDLSPLNATLISLNPFNFYLFLGNEKNFQHPENLPFKYCMATPGNLTPKSFLKLFNSLPDHKETPYFFLSSNNIESFKYLEMICNYVTFFFGKTITITKSNSHISINFYMGLSESPTKTLQLISNIQSIYSKSDENKTLSNLFPIITSNTTSKQFKILSCNCPPFNSIIYAFFQEICRHYNLNFKLEQID